MFLAKIEPNKELEELRNNIPAQPNINIIIESLITVPKIHAAYLYINESRSLLQKLCRYLGATKSSYYYAGWEEFGIRLGLDSLLIQYIKNNHLYEDPVSQVILAYVQKNDASMEQIIFSLRDIKRHDIILELKDLFNKLFEILLGQNIDKSIDIIKPPMIPDCPFPLKNLELETPCRSISQKAKHSKTAFLTFSCDTDQFVNNYLTQLRTPKNNTQLGIVVLKEQIKNLTECPDQFIFECFEQVDYVVAILTPHYIEHIMTNKICCKCNILENPDHKYVKYIYRLINSSYVQNDCRNTKFRCIIPDKYCQYVLQHPIMNHCLFQVWVTSQDINVLIDALLK